ncbi:MAG: hypothetical protein AAB818_00700, partial [Patescibacteria group bacterium]
VNYFKLYHIFLKNDFQCACATPSVAQVVHLLIDCSKCEFRYNHNYDTLKILQDNILELS